jgi:hypothetical protein
MGYGKLAAIILVALCLCGTLAVDAGSGSSMSGETPVALTPFGEAVLAADAARDARVSDMSVWIKTAQARCPPGQLVFLTNACGCNGACCACSAQMPFLDHCSCQCQDKPPPSCNRGFSAGRR